MADVGTLRWRDTSQERANASGGLTCGVLPESRPGEAVPPLGLGSGRVRRPPIYSGIGE